MIISKFAEIEIFITEGMSVGICQPMYGEEDQVIHIPHHQAHAVCKAIMLAAKKASVLISESSED